MAINDSVTVSCPSGVPPMAFLSSGVTLFPLFEWGLPLMRKEFRVLSFVETLAKVCIAEPQNYREHHVISAKNYQSTLNCPGDIA